IPGVLPIVPPLLAARLRMARRDGAQGSRDERESHHGHAKRERSLHVQPPECLRISQPISPNRSGSHRVRAACSKVSRTLARPVLPPPSSGENPPGRLQEIRARQGWVCGPVPALAQRTPGSVGAPTIVRITAV